jgi:outer membrane protein OmpA-like peptidoglycan-associated protein
VDDVRFAFDSSFVNADPDPDNRNDIGVELRDLVDLREKHREAPLSVFGHADPVGSDDYNKLLSGRRAMAIYAVLVANGEPDRAVKLWDYVSRQEQWGKNQREAMHTFTGLPSGTPDSTLYCTYLQKLCPPELELKKKDFLGQGVDGGGKADFQGCGEFNPVLLFSKEKQAEFDRAQQQNDKAGIESRNAANARNRRVLVLMFRKGSRVDPSKWPCPRTTEGVAGCVKRFWSDGEKRRSTHLPNSVDRTFEDKKDTFACRFYQRISDSSPCDKIVRTVRVRLFDREANLLVQAPFVMITQGQAQSGFTNANGEALLRDVELPANCLVQWSRPSALLDRSKPPDPTWQDFEFQHIVFVTLVPSDAVTTFAETPLPPGSDSQRLSNMGYIFKDTPETNVQAFQRDAGLSPSGSLEEAASTIREQHDDLIAPPKPFRGDGALSNQEV